MTSYKIFYILMIGFFCFKTAYVSKYCEVLSSTSDYVVTIPPLNISTATQLSRFQSLQILAIFLKKISNVPSNIMNIKVIVNTVSYKDKVKYTIN
ncbi:hypothetical protein I6L80_21120 (plasmid) [Providencia rettgeri]|uniref:Uncharacterized protein n=1 Tax=Providencia rettgeri TaxID=587 RepID=A0A379LRN7_PRORE|nr:hypothetical protein [Providencia rettgeri]QXB07783.1 hypothetical protein I6L80_21120 [Providencia rettgeri]SUD99059.1 Uncharacterised protein [Providencia rettgeri]